MPSPASKITIDTEKYSTDRSEYCTVGCTIVRFYLLMRLLNEEGNLINFSFLVSRFYLQTCSVGMRIERMEDRVKVP